MLLKKTASFINDKDKIYHYNLKNKVMKMNYAEFQDKCKIIKKTFDDDRQIICPTPKEYLNLDENSYQGGDVFTTEDGNFINLDMQLVDFDEDELIKQIDFSERIYEQHHKSVANYIICPKNVNVTVRECELMSEANFTIKLACVQEDACEVLLSSIKNKIKNNERLNGDDIHALSMLSVMCHQEERDYYRREYLKIINKLDY